MDEGKDGTICATQGTMKFTIAGEEHICDADTLIHVPAGVPHSYASVGDTVAKLTWLYQWRMELCSPRIIFASP